MVDKTHLSVKIRHCVKTIIEVNNINKLPPIFSAVCEKITFN